MSDNNLTIALSKGRIFDETLPLLAAAGITPAEDPEKSRKLIIQTNRPDIRLVIVRASDVPTYVQYGAADFGIAGKDVLIEHGGSGLYQPLDLQIAKCRMMVAVKKGFDYAAASQPGCRLRVATKYPDIAAEHFAGKGVHVDIIKLYGSMELAPLVGLSDAIVDLVSTGNTQSQPPRSGGAHYRYFQPPCGKQSRAESEICRHPADYRCLCRRHRQANATGRLK